jgi:tetratricopeptide (TPR) repeat protein
MDLGAPRPRHALVLPALLAGATLAVYANSLGGGFVWDDEVIVVEGTLRSAGGIAQALLAPDVVRPYYRPVTRASFHLDAAAWGARPMGFHAVNVALHLANVLALFFLARLLFGSPWLAFGAALLLAVHPINAETVDFISARNNLLALLFLQGALGLILVAARSGSRMATWGSGASWFLALGSKESAAAGVLLLAGCALWPGGERKESGVRRLGRLAPHTIFLGVYLGLRHLALGGAGAGLRVQELSEVARINYHAIPRYLGLILFPAGLNVFHGVPAGGVAASPWLFVAWLAIGMAVAGLVLQRSAPSLVGLGWFLVNFLPVANIVPIPSASMAERFIYLPAVGFWVIGADQGLRLIRRVSWKRGMVALQTAAVLALAATTVRRNLDWRDDLALFRSSVEEDPRSSLGHFNLGTTLRDQGDLAGARRAWERAIEIDPRDVGALVQLGTVAAVQGDLLAADRMYRRALAVEPTNPTATLNLAKVCERTGRYPEAVDLYGRFLDLATPGEAEHVEAARASRDRLRKASGSPQ